MSGKKRSKGWGGCGGTGKEEYYLKCILHESSVKTSTGAVGVLTETWISTLLSNKN